MLWSTDPPCVERFNPGLCIFGRLGSFCIPLPCPQRCVPWDMDIAKEEAGKYSTDDAERPTPSELDVHRKFHYHDHPGQENLHGTHAEALWDRPEVDLVAGAERDRGRLKAFGERYGISALYSDAAEMLSKEKLDLVTVSTNVKGRSDLVCMAVENGARGIMTDYPMAHTLEEADRMLKACADAGVPLCIGGLIGNHPSFAGAKELVTSGAIGEVVSVEGEHAWAQNQHWTYFLDSAAAWVSGTGDLSRAVGKCTGGAEQNCTTERHKMII